MHRLVGRQKSLHWQYFSCTCMVGKESRFIFYMFMRQQKEQRNFWRYNVKPSAIVLHMPRLVCGFVLKLDSDLFMILFKVRINFFFVVFLTTGEHFHLYFHCADFLADHNWINEKNYLLFLQFLLSNFEKFRQNKQDPIFHLGTHTSRELLVSVSLFSQNITLATLSCLS